MLRILLSLIALTLVAYFMGTPAQAAPVAIRGSRVLLEKPDGFTTPTNFTGLALESKQASILITELPAPFDKVTAGFSEEGLTSRGMHLLEKKSMSVGKYPGMFLELTQSAAGQTFHKWMLAFGDSNKTVIVTGTAPKDSEKTLTDTIKSSVLSALYDDNAPAPDPFADLPFTLPGSKSMKFAQRIQNMLMFTPTGTVEPKSADKSLFLVGQALSDTTIGDQTLFAKNRLLQSSQLSNLEIISEGDTNVSGMPAREILASATGNDGEKLFVYQTIAYGKGSYFIIQGIANLDKRTQREPEFKAMVKSFKLK